MSRLRTPKRHQFRSGQKPYPGDTFSCKLVDKVHSLHLVQSLSTHLVHAFKLLANLLLGVATKSTSQLLNIGGSPCMRVNLSPTSFHLILIVGPFYDVLNEAPVTLKWEG